MSHLIEVENLGLPSVFGRRENVVNQRGFERFFKRRERDSRTEGTGYGLYPYHLIRDPVPSKETSSLGVFVRKILDDGICEKNLNRSEFFYVIISEKNKRNNFI